ncbi:cytochrome P450 [Shewanella corallii]|uniref:Cytochrome P450 n=1 Tax=Shewanella corallii TaxID=560080 RepID=A0ABT0NAM8_9GAMM|nr:cytochrome P450 [Shewanella corallii]MCL2915479.1 cytochrome P450 [Shewanella corallii]
MQDQIQNIDFFAPETIQNPFVANKIAREQAPVYKIPGMDNTFMVFSYEHVLEVTSQPDLFSSKSSSPLLGKSLHSEECRRIYAQGWPQTATLLTNDPPSHDRFRKLVNHAFTFAKVQRMSARIEETCHSLIDSFVQHGQFEVAHQFSIPLPVKVIGDQLGIPQQEHHLVKEWSDAFVGLLGSMQTEEEDQACARRVVEFQHYMKNCHDQRRSKPTDDMLNDLVYAKTEDSNSLSTSELLNVSQQLLVAGNETTTNLITGGMLLLAEHPDQMQLVKEDPSLIPNMVEEMLRLESPSNTMWRTATQDTRLNGVEIPANATVLVRFGSANRDETVFENPDKFDVTRSFTRKHLAFGNGIHTCIGAMLSRKESSIAFKLLLERLNNIRLTPGKNKFRRFPNILLRGLETLHLDFDS